MSEPAMMSEPYGSTPKATDHIQVGSLSRQGEGQRRERCFAIQSGTPHARAGQEVGDRFQAEKCILFHLAVGCGARRVRALGTTVISAGRLPMSSPSAST